MGSTLSVPLLKKHYKKVHDYFNGELQIPNSDYPLRVHDAGGYSPSRKDLICFNYSTLNEQGHHFAFTLCRMLALHFGKKKRFSKGITEEIKYYHLPYYFYDDELWIRVKPVPYKPLISEDKFEIKLNSEQECFNVSEPNGYCQYHPWQKKRSALIHKLMGLPSPKKLDKENKEILEKIISELKALNPDFTPIPKKEVRELEHTTDRIENHYPKSPLHRQSFLALHGFLLEWYHTWNLRAGYVKEKWKKAKELLGPATYHVTHSHQNALWGIKYKNAKFLIYMDERGTGVQVEGHPDEKIIGDFITELARTLRK